MEDTKTKDAGHDTGRRSFLKLAGVSAPAAVALTAQADVAAAADTPVAGDGMRKTPHTDAYYKSARF